MSEYTAEVNLEIEDKDACKVFGLSGLRLYECPISYLSSFTQEIMRLVVLIQDTGTLLYSGGWGDQPYSLVEAYYIFKEEAQRRDKAKKPAK